MKNIPDDTLVEIFILLPYRSIVRCKCVCKSWFRLISTHFFVKEFVSRQHSLFKTYFTFLSPYQLMLTFLPPSELNNNDKTNENGVSLSPGMLINGDVCGYCNGLFLCCSNRYTSGYGYFVYDPLTKETIHIPLVSGAVIWKQHLYAVGFNSTTKNSIRVFSVVLVKSFEHTSFEFKVNIFSSEVGHWSKIVVSVDDGFAFAPQWLHSLAHQEYLCFMGQTKILVVDPDLTLSDAYTINYPQGVDGMNIVNCGFFGRTKGFLRIGYIGHTNELRVWELVWKKDDITDNEKNPYQFWFLMHMINLSAHIPAQFCGNYFKRVAGFHPYDEDIVYLHSYVDGVFIVNLRTNGFEHVPDHDKFDIIPFQLELPIPTSDFISGEHESIIFQREDSENQKIQEIRRCSCL